MEPKFEIFTEDGEWYKPLNARHVDVILKGGSGGSASFVNGSVVRAQGAEGGIVATSMKAEDLPGRIQITAGGGGQPDGRNGYVVIVTHYYGDNE